MSWIATLAILMASLAPTVSQALGSGRGGEWVEVCSAQGARWVRGGTTESGQRDPAPLPMFEQCAYCSIHMPAWSMPPQLVPMPQALRAEAQRPPLVLKVAHTAHAWVGAQPRAPPTAC